MARFGDLVSAGETNAALERLLLAARQLILGTSTYDAVMIQLIAQSTLACGSIDAKGVDLFIEKTLDKLLLTRLLKVKSLLGQLLDECEWAQNMYRAISWAKVCGARKMLLRGMRLAGGKNLQVWRRSHRRYRETKGNRAVVSAMDNYSGKTPSGCIVKLHNVLYLPLSISKLIC